MNRGDLNGKARAKAMDSAANNEENKSTKSPMNGFRLQTCFEEIVNCEMYSLVAAVLVSDGIEIQGTLPPIPRPYPCPS